MNSRHLPACLLAAGVLLAPMAPAAAQEAAPQLSTEKQRYSYAIGLNLGKGMARQELDVDVDLLIQGLRTGLAGTEALLDDEELMAVLQAFQQTMVAKQQQEMEKMAGEALQRSTAFLAENAQREGVVTRESGLQYEVLTAGSGPQPTEEDWVTVHYRGTLADGTVFDSSYDRGEPASFPIGGVIAGWKEALPLMSVGAKWKIFIPPALAYGERGAGAVIGPNEALIFEVELLSIGEPEAPAESPE